MELRHLRYFLAVGEALNFTKLLPAFGSATGIELIVVGDSLFRVSVFRSDPDISRATRALIEYFLLNTHTSAIDQLLHFNPLS
jgi:hypothetical protein